MPRYFKPIGGFDDKSIDHIKIDDNGFSHYVAKDGTEQLAAHTDHRKHSNPVWSLAELENLVNGGRWVEITDPLRSTTPSVSLDEFNKQLVAAADKLDQAATNLASDVGNAEEASPAKP